MKAVGELEAMTISLVVLWDNDDFVKRGERPYFPSNLTTDYERFPMLWSVDPEGVTIFNKHQTKQILLEVKELLGGDLADDERASLEAVAELCHFIWDGVPHLYLWFTTENKPWFS